jgi:3-oxoacyl-[acyl-carrier-protein] synthase II
MRRIAVTGIGLVSPLGNHPAVFFERLMAGESGIRRLETEFVDQLAVKIAAPISDFDPLAYFPKSKANSLDRVTQFALVAAQQAITDAALTLETEARERIGIYLGTGMGGATSIEEGYVRLYRDQLSRLKPYTVLMAMNNAAGSQIALDFGLTGPSLTFSTACSSSSVAIGEACRLIRHGYADIMLAGGSEALLTYGTIKAWEALRTLAEEDPTNAAASCKPFSANRTGLVLGEGAAIVVLEDDARAVARGAPLHAEIIGYGSSNDSALITQPSVAGQARAMNLALANAGIAASELDYINAHATSTPQGDMYEAIAIDRLFGASRPLVSSTKSMTGHECWMAGASEIVYSILMMQNSFVAPNINFETPDEDSAKLNIAAKTTEKNINTFLSNSFGFGGTNSALIIKNLNKK